MPIYIVKVNDSLESNLQDQAIEKAKKELAKRKTAYAAIYGYKSPNGKIVYLHEPLIKFSQAEVDEFDNAITSGKKHPGTITLAIYRHHLDDKCKEC